MRIAVGLMLKRKRASEMSPTADERLAGMLMTAGEHIERDVAFQVLHGLGRMGSVGCVGLCVAGWCGLQHMSCGMSAQHDGDESVWLDAALSDHMGERVNAS
jgi:hypothetical protein